MHFLIGFGIVVGLIAFAYGSNAAQSFVRGAVAVAGLALFGLILWFAIGTWDEMQYAAKSGHAVDAYFPPEPRCGYACETSHSDIDGGRESINYGVRK
jgi:hypothetical protein